MSCFGSLYKLMKRSGLMPAREEIYDSNAVKHVMSGKAISRILRVHVLIDSALIRKLLK